LENQKNQKDQKKSNFSGIDKYAKYSAITFQMIAIILVAVWGGLKLDEKFNDGNPLFIIILGLLGVFAGIYLAVKDFINFRK
jgi:F0F1-type ATP synthase assembly protein I